MGRHRRHHGPTGVSGALVIIVFGVLLLLHENGILRWHDLWRLWPMLLVFAGFVRLGQYSPHGKITGVFLIAIGGVLELAEFRVIPYSVRELWPLGIIGLGLYLLWLNLQPKTDAVEPEVEVEGRFSYKGPKWSTTHHFTIFGGGERRISQPDFTHAELTAIFGGYKLDLRKSTIQGASAVIDATAIFGGMEIIVPETWNVVVRGVGIFGGYGDETHHPSPADQPPELIVQGVALFGGVAIKN
jgi:predicted membrane protein